MTNKHWLDFHNKQTTIFRVTPGNCLDFMEKWAVQNNAEVIDCAEGCLIDNVLFAARRGYAAFYETYVNCYQSTYTIVFLPYNDTCNERHALFWDEWESVRGCDDE